MARVKALVVLFVTAVLSQHEFETKYMHISRPSTLKTLPETTHFDVNQFVLSLHQRSAALSRNLYLEDLDL